MTIHSRQFNTEDDYTHMRQLSIDTLQLTGKPVYATIGDLDWWRCSDEDAKAIYNAHLWFDEGQLVAWAWPVDDQVDIMVHPEYPALHDVALIWAEDEYRQRQGDLLEKPMRAWGFTGDVVRNAALTARGYQRTDGGLVLYSRPAIPGAALPSLPVGYRFDHVRGEVDVARRTAVQCAAFESTFMTETKTRALMAAPTYRPELDIVIVAPDDSFAAFAQVWLDETNGTGVFEPLGVSADHRRRGLARTILDEGIRRLGQLGASVAWVQTGLTHEAGRATYLASGFTELDRDYAWIRPLD